MAHFPPNSILRTRGYKKGCAVRGGWLTESTYMSLTRNGAVLSYDEYKKRRRQQEEASARDWCDRYYTRWGGKQVSVRSSPQTPFREGIEELPQTGDILSGKALFRRLWKREKGKKVNNLLRNDEEQYRRFKRHQVEALASQLRVPYIKDELIRKAMVPDFRKYASYGGTVAGVLAIASTMMDGQREEILDGFEYPEDRIINTEEVRVGEDLREIVERNEVNLSEAIDKYNENQ